MSYILDALKKAERDRRRAHVPTLATMHALPPERRRVWPWVVGGVIALNVAAVAAFVWRPVPVPAPVAAPPAPVTAPAPPPAPPPAPAATAATRKAPAPATAAPDHARPAPPPRPAGTEPGRAPKAVPTAPAVAKPDAPAKASPPGREPAKEAARAETLKLEVLISSDHAAERAAYINGQRYVEGQRVEGRFLVERIQRDGVVLVQDGRRFVLRQQ